MKKNSIASYTLVVLSLALSFKIVPVYAANFSITGGTYGTTCTSGGYFTPSSVTINGGDTVTITVPANDPYAGGLEIHGFPQGSFTVARGGSVTTNAITANVNYYGTWPSTGCMKGSGAITVSAPTPTPTPTPAPTPTPTPTPSPTTAAPKASTTTTTPKTTTTTTPAATQPTTSTTATPTTTQTTTTKPKPSDHTVASATTTTPSPKSLAFKTVAAVGGASLAVLGAVAVLVWRLILRRRMHTPLPTPPTNQPTDPPPP
ncbi:MAG TPA: hypothetical protein VNE40_00820 [Candidatus Dormibacteraeota bacterium]|nr:hypothetical protein [Candidatus Dormibacteraeota bacterium]